MTALRIQPSSSGYENRIHSAVRDRHVHKLGGSGILAPLNRMVGRLLARWREE